jgi:type IV pilus assembly protein PilQ
MRARSAMLPVVAVGLLMAGSAALRATSSAVQLVEVRSRLDAGRHAVVLEASAPVAYTSSQPDPFTVIVDLRHVSTATTVNRLASTGAGPVTGVSLETATAADGAGVARVRLGLAQPAAARVQSDRNQISIEFPEVPPAEVAPPTASSPPAASTVATAASPGAATQLVSVVSEKVDGHVRVRLRGNGTLTPRGVEEARDLPPRLVIDLPGVSSRVPAVLPVGGADLARIRVATNSQSPLVTRVVLDLTQRLPYRLDRQGDRELVIDLGEATTPAAAATAPVSAPAVTTAVERAAVAPEPAIVPDRDPATAATDAAPADPIATGSSGAAAPTPVATAPVTPAVVSASAAPAKTAAADLLRRHAAPQAATSPTTQAPTTASLKTSGMVKSDDDRPTTFTGHPVSLDFEGVDLRAVLRTFAEITGLNIVIDPAVQGTVDVALRDVPWDQALDIILRANQLGYAVDGTIVRIAPLSVLSAEEGAKRKLVEERALSGQLQVMTRPLNYAKAAATEPLLKHLLSTRGKTAVDARTNALIVYDLPEYLQKVTTLLDALDQAELQVEIEARIVQTRKEFARELGVKWGFGGAVAPELGNTTSLAFPNAGTIDGDAGPISSGRVRGRDAVGITLNAINGAFRIEAELSALEEAGLVKSLLTPRIVTQNNVKATITRGEEIPYTTTSAAPPSGADIITTVPTVQFKTAALTLAVTPHITGADTVVLEVDVDNGSPGTEQANGNISINTQRAQTTVLVADGATTVIGGIQGLTERETSRRTPGLWKLPWIGRLFRDDIKAEENQELLIFITPRIIRMPASATSPAPATSR